MRSTITVRFIKPYRQYKCGDVATLAAELGDRLWWTGLADIVRDDKVETATAGRVGVERAVTRGRETRCQRR